MKLKISNNMMPHVMYPTPIPAKILECFLWSKSMALGSAEKAYANQPLNYFRSIPTYVTTKP